MKTTAQKSASDERKSSHLPYSVKHFDDLPDSALISLKSAGILLDRSRTTLYRLIDAGILPKPRKVNGQNQIPAGDLRRVMQGDV